MVHGVLASPYGVVIFTAAVVVALALIGRQRAPRLERLPIASWHLRDLSGNAVLGWFVLLDIGERAYQQRERFRRHPPPA